MVESFTNVEGQPSILRVETSGDNDKLKIPPFVRVLREVTGEDQYESVNMADLDYKMPAADKIVIKEKLHQLE
jgi:hypothetical protein